jgi:adenine-specific DNA-methyltransferase
MLPFRVTLVLHYWLGGPSNSHKRAEECLEPEIAMKRIRTVSRPFNKPESGKIAVKVINHNDDDVLKVFRVETKDCQ